MEEGDRRFAERRAAMGDFKHLRVKRTDLAQALDFHHSEMSWFLDLENGEIFLVTEEEREEKAEDFFEDPRYEPIHPLESFRSFGIMEDFVEDLPEGRPRTTLAAALGRRKPFRSFKDALAYFPDLREAWFRFHDGRLMRLAEEWLEEHAPGAQFEN